MSLPRAYRSPLFHAFWMGPVAVVFGLCCLNLTVVERLRDQVFDLYQRTAPRAYDPTIPVRVVDIDDESIERIGQWPWPRTQIATLVERLHDNGAAAISFDMVFSEKDRTSPDAIVAAIQDPSRQAAVRGALAGTRDNDAVLAQALAGAPVVLGMILSQSDATPPFAAPFGIAAAGDDPRRFVTTFPGAVAPLPVLAEQTSGLGALNWLPDSDQIVRRLPLLLSAGGRLVPSLAMEGVRVAQGASTFVVRSANASGDGASGQRGVQSIKVGPLLVESDPRGDVRLRFTEHRSERFVSAWKILDPGRDWSSLKGSIVIVGSSSAGLGDLRATPVDPAMPGVEVQAQAVEGLILRDRLIRPDWAVLEPAVGLVLAVALIAVLPIVPAVAGAATTIACVAAIVAASWWAFCGRHLLLDPIVPGAMVLVAYLGGTSALFRAEQKDRRFVQDAFGRFVSPDVVARLARNPGQLTLGGEQRELTVMFTDVRNFSAIAERLGPQDLTRFMNRYLSPMSEIILAHAGTVDKYIGDAIMAFWNAPMPDPNHAEHGARAALAMLAALDDLRSELTASDTGIPPLRCGFGLASGPCVVGNLGSSLRFDYSALGDDVNLASRLQNLTKTYGLDILATEATMRLTPGLAWLMVDTVVVKGREAQTRIATLLGDEVLAGSAGFRAFGAAHDAMLAMVRDGHFEEAVSAIGLLKAVAPAPLDAMYDVYLEKCRSGAIARRDDGTARHAINA